LNDYRITDLYIKEIVSLICHLKILRSGDSKVSFFIIDEAIDMLRAGMSLAENIKDPYQKASLLRMLASAFEDLGLKEEAKELFLDAAKTAMKIDEIEERISEIRMIASELRYSGYLEESFKVLEEAVNQITSDVEVYGQLYALEQIAEEYLDAKALDMAREIVYRIMEIYPRLEEEEIEDLDILLDGFKLIAIFEKGNELREYYNILLGVIQRIEDMEIKDSTLLDLIGIIVKLGWIDDIKEVILNMISDNQKKIEAITKFVSYVASQIEKLKEYPLESEEDLL